MKCVWPDIARISGWSVPLCSVVKLEEPLFLEQSKLFKRIAIGTGKYMATLRAFFFIFVNFKRFPIRAWYPKQKKRDFLVTNLFCCCCRYWNFFVLPYKRRKNWFKFVLPPTFLKMKKIRFFLSGKSQRKFCLLFLHHFAPMWEIKKSPFKAEKNASERVKFGTLKMKVWLLLSLSLPSNINSVDENDATRISNQGA